jgi:hypothetical protein
MQSSDNPSRRGLLSAALGAAAAALVPAWARTPDRRVRRLAELLGVTLARCDELLDAHPDDCQCSMCDDTWRTRYTLRLIRIALGGMPSGSTREPPLRLVGDLAGPCDPYARRLVESLWPVIDAGRALVASHGEECGCDTCDHAWAAIFNAEQLEDLVGGELRQWPARCRREAEEARKDGRPDSVRLWERLAGRFES